MDLAELTKAVDQLADSVNHMMLFLIPGRTRQSLDHKILEEINKEINELRDRLGVRKTPRPR